MRIEVPLPHIGFYVGRARSSYLPPLQLIPCFHIGISGSRDRTRPWRCIDLNAYRYPRLKVSGSCMSSRSVALVNNLSPDVDNANTGYNAAREIVAPTPYIEYVGILILCLCCVWLTIFRPLRVACWVDHSHWLSCSRRISSRAAHQCLIVSGIASVISANILDQVYGHRKPRASTVSIPARSGAIQ
jgi:hypothetical protein